MMLADTDDRTGRAGAVRLLLSAYACRPGAGSEVGIGWNWAQHLAETGAEVDVLTASRNRSEAELFAGQHPELRLRFHYVHVPFLSEWSHGAKHYLLWNLGAWRLARKLARARQWDAVVHVSYGSVHLPTQLWRLGLPTVFGPVGGGQVTAEELLPYFGTQVRNERRRTALTRMLPSLPFYRSSMRHMRVVLGANSETVSLARRAGATDVRLMCDTGLREDYRAERPRQFEPGGATRLLWVGRFMPRKGLLLALDALQHSTPEVSLTLLGDGLDPGEVKRLIDERGLAGRVHWTGERVGWMEVRECYRTHDALFFTSLRDTFGSQLLEAMSQGLPVVALSMNGARDFLPVDGAIKVEPATTAEATRQRLTAALNEYARTGAEQRSRMSEVVWRSAQEFAWPRRAEQMLTIVSDIMAAGVTA